MERRWHIVGAPGATAVPVCRCPGCGVLDCHLMLNRRVMGGPKWGTARREVMDRECLSCGTAWLVELGPADATRSA